MRKFIGLAVIFALLSFVGSASGAVGVNNDHDDVESYVGEASNICFEGQDVSFDGSQVTVASGNLLGLIQAAQEMKSFNKEALKEYYRKAYGYEEAELEKLCQYLD